MKKEQLEVGEIRKKGHLDRMRVGVRSEVLKHGRLLCANPLHRIPSRGGDPSAEAVTPYLQAQMKLPVQIREVRSHNAHRGGGWSRRPERPEVELRP